MSYYAAGGYYRAGGYYQAGGFFKKLIKGVKHFASTGVGKLVIGGAVGALGVGALYETIQAIRTPPGAGSAVAAITASQAGTPGLVAHQSALARSGGRHRYSRYRRVKRRRSYAY